MRANSSEKWVFILSYMKQNKNDARKPRGFQLPQIERPRNAVMLEGRKKLYPAKLDVSSCFWSVRLPQQWVGVFSVNVGDTQYVWNSLPFGWTYSPQLCQKLVYSVVRVAMWWLPVLFFVFLDNILIVGTRRFLRKAIRRARHRLQKVGFIVSKKCKTEPAKHLEIVGKIFDLYNGTLENRRSTADKG